MNVDVYIVNEMIRSNYRFISSYVESRLLYSRVGD